MLPLIDVLTDIIFAFLNVMNVNSQAVAAVGFASLLNVIVGPILYGEEPLRHHPINPHTPVAQKVGDDVFFRRLQGEGANFFEIGPH